MIRRMPHLLLALLLAIWCSRAAFAAAVDDTFHKDVLDKMGAEIRLAIADGRLPGGVVWLERQGVAYHAAFGQRAVEPGPEVMTEDTIFDAASLTKVLATTPAVMLLIETGKIELDAPVAKYLPEFTGAGKEAVTIRHLLTHTSGTNPGISTKGWDSYASGIARACSASLNGTPGELVRYSDVNFILLGEIVQRISGQSLAEYCAVQFFRPLGMKDTQFLPTKEVGARIAPTTRDVARGIVHDPTSRQLGGVAGHAGLFTTAADVARYCRMLLQGGELDGVRVLKVETVQLMTSVQTPKRVPTRRGLGWDIDTGYSGPRGKWFPLGSYGHTGWTGGSLWIDPFSETFVIFLSNRNHPTEDGNVLPLRRTLGTLAAEAVKGFNFLHVPGSLHPNPGATISLEPHSLNRTEVLTGIDVLEREKFAPLKGLKIGLITNHTGIDRQRRRNIDVLQKAPGVELVALFSPEHGIAGKADEKIDDGKDEASGLTVFSLYGERRVPTPEQLSNIDALVYDIQDIGCRFYTYSSTLGECLSAAAKAGKKFFVLDRPNPIGGVTVEGPMRDGPSSFVAWHNVPVRHGLTLGELARLYNQDLGLGADLTVIRCEGWQRGQWYDETELPWVNPSPNMRTLNAAVLYPGVGLIEFCNVSVGRGTDSPFEFVGAPYIDDLRLAEELNAAGLSGVSFVPVRFTPRASVFSGKECRGVQLVVTDRGSVASVDVGLEFARALQRLYPEQWKGENLAKLLVDPATQKAVLGLEGLPAIHETWISSREKFRPQREKVLLY